MVGGLNNDTFADGCLQKLELDEDNIPNIDLTTENQRLIGALTEDQLRKLCMFKSPSQALKAIFIDRKLKENIKKKGFAGYMGVYDITKMASSRMLQSFFNPDEDNK